MSSTFLRNTARLLRERGVKGIARMIFELICPARSPAAESLQSIFRDGVGIEIGGPSRIFKERGYFPVYPLAAALDNCNFADDTLWEGSISAGRSFFYDRQKSPGFQYIGEASALSAVVDGKKYDYVISSHALEHLANPIASLLDWKSVLREEGKLLLVLPHKDCTFDHQRPVTTIEHLIEDYENGVGEDDQTHVEEVLALHDLGRDPGAVSADSFRERTLNNLANRGLHHHVFDGLLTARLLDYCKFKINFMECARPYNIIAVASVPATSPESDSVDKETTRSGYSNEAFLSENASFRKSSPFHSDSV